VSERIEAVSELLDERAMRLAIMRATEQIDDCHSPWTRFADKVMNEYRHRGEWLALPAPTNALERVEEAV